jgi:hypothetical protein
VSVRIVVDRSTLRPRDAARSLLSGEVDTREAPDIDNHGQLIWAIADLLRGDYKQSEYGRVILPLVVLRRLDCVLEPSKDSVLARLTASRVASRTSARCSRRSRASRSTTPPA